MRPLLPPTVVPARLTVATHRQTRSRPLVTATHLPLRAMTIHSADSDLRQKPV